MLDPLMQDLHTMQTVGVDLGETYGVRKARVVFVLGDNLGSHMIGGFVENFSGKYFCRYCLANRECFESGNCLPENFQKRTCENYNSAIQHLEVSSADNFEGIKTNSVLHSLPDFHVCMPSMSPCYGHDLFEGIVPGDLTLCLTYLIRQKKWFSVDYLNRRINAVKLKGPEATDRPPHVNTQTLKVSGHAVQMSVLIRFIPVLIGHKVEDTDDSVWRLIQLLRDIMDLVCTPVATLEHVAYIQDSNQEHIENRVRLFPHNKLKPKHHFLAHYPDLTLQCGPLIRLWTLRFEGKHSYFKNCARTATNFKNITKTLTEKHQLLQTLYSSGSLFGPEVSVVNGLPFHYDLHNQNVMDAVKPFQFLHNSKHTLVTDSITVNAINYNSGMYVTSHREGEQLICGEIKLILVHENTNPFLVTLPRKTKFLTDVGLHEICANESETVVWNCIAISLLLDLYPMNAYVIGFYNFLVLHHAV